MYSLKNFGELIGDTVRMEAYVAALRAAIKPGDVVLDLGAGTGIMALIASTLGASQVYAIDSDDAISLLPELARINRSAARIEAIQAISQEVSLEQRAQVIVSDLRGVLPLFGQHLPSIIDARKRLLAPGGILIPAVEVIWFAPVADPKLHAAHRGVWDQAPYGLQLQEVLRWRSNQSEKVYAKNESLACPAQPWMTLDYALIESSDHQATLEWQIEQPAVAHGLLGWFDSQLYHDIGFSNAPGRPRVIYGQQYFPWPEAVALAPGDRLVANICANLVKGEYIWRWDTSVLSARGEQKAAFRQSTFHGLLFPLKPAAKAR